MRRVTVSTVKKLDRSVAKESISVAVNPVVGVTIDIVTVTVLRVVTPPTVTSFWKTRETEGRRGSDLLAPRTTNESSGSPKDKVDFVYRPSDLGAKLMVCEVIVPNGIVIHG